MRPLKTSEKMVQIANEIVDIDHVIKCNAIARGVLYQIQADSQDLREACKYMLDESFKLCEKRLELKKKLSLMAVGDVNDTAP